MEVKIPYYSPEQNKENMENLKNGDTLVRFRRTALSSKIYIQYFKVKNITPTGKVRLDNNNLLNSISGYYPMTDEIKELIKKVERQNEIESCLNVIERTGKGFFKELSEEDEIMLLEILKKSHIFKKVEE